MAKYQRIVTTEAGLKLLAAAVAGETITFTAVKTGSGIYDGTEVLEEATDIKNVQQTFGVTGISRTGAQIKLRTVFSNETVTTGYDITEIGLYAKDSGSGTEILFAIIIAETGLGDCLPPYEDAPTSITMEIYLTLTEAEEQVTFAAEVVAGTYVPVEDFNDVLSGVIKVGAAGNADKLGGLDSTAFMKVASALANGLVSEYLMSTAISESFTIRNLLERNTVTFFTNWVDITNFPIQYGSGIMLPGMDGNHRLIFYSGAANSTKADYIGKAEKVDEVWNVKWICNSDNGDAATLGGFKATDFVFTDGSNQKYDSVKDVNKFYTGVGLFSENVANTPSANWWLIIAGGVSGTTTQVAFCLENDRPARIRKCAAGTWGGWGVLNVGALKLTGGIMAGNIDMNSSKIMGCAGSYAATLGDQYAHAGIEIREKEFVENANLDIGYAPALGFHWAGAAGGAILMDSGGQFHFVRSDGSYCQLKTATANVIISDTAPADTTALWVS